MTLGVAVDYFAVEKGLVSDCVEGCLVDALKARVSKSTHGGLAGLGGASANALASAYDDRRALETAVLQKLEGVGGSLSDSGFRGELDYF